MTRINIRRLTFVMALALCLGAVFASQHWHGEDCGEDVCAVSVFTDSGSATGSSVPDAAGHLVHLPAGAATPSAIPVSRPFEPRRSRAPPIY